MISRVSIAMSLLLILGPVFFASQIATGGQPPKISPRVNSAFDAAASNATIAVYVYFTDKGPNTEASLRDPSLLVSERALQRRKKVMPAGGHLVDLTDVPLYRPYVLQLASCVSAIRHELRWLNCVSVDMTKAQSAQAAALSCVQKIDLVERATVIKDEREQLLFDNILKKRTSVAADSLDYGASLAQDTLINVTRVHQNGIYGQGVIIAHFDAGYTNLNHEAFTSYPMKIWKKKDFHTGDTVTLASNFHGQATLSLVGGYAPGKLIGPAFASTFVLCRTEVDPTETPIEMDHWAAAAQWAESLGVDVITSSLGYLVFDAPASSYTYLDMNGHTLVVTKAAELAAQKGIAVFNSAGNQGENADHNTLGGPADAADVITVGAVDYRGMKAKYSSVGPTTDDPPRIKPDIMAQGSFNQVATQNAYSTSGSGTSWACPMAAGVGACMLSANKNLTPTQIRDILRHFAHNAGSPNNLIGWGLIDAERSVDSARALDRTPPVIVHTQPFTSTADTGSVSLTAQITDNGIIRFTRTNEAPRVYYRKNSGAGWSAWTSVIASAMNDPLFSFIIPGSLSGTSVQYYFAAQDIALPHALVSTLPAGGSGSTQPGTIAPASFFQYQVGATTIVSLGSGVPADYRLWSNYPNPFNPSTEIIYDLPRTEYVAIKIYDIDGRQVRDLVGQMQSPGRYRVRFDATNLVSGIYLCRLSTASFSAQIKMIFVK
ncbi:MAG TPA: S8 family peptidase [Bacteroidota bacterium]|nr:S8 family peptidase [Bacteroidota bacterium]